MALVGRIWTRRAAALTILSFLLLCITVLLSGSHNGQPRVADVLAAPAIRGRHVFDPSPRDFNTTKGIHARAPSPPPCSSATDEVYNRAREKGELLICYMKNPSAAGALQTSKWDNYRDLEEWGWVETTTGLWGGEKEPGFKDIVGDAGWSNVNKNVRFDHVKQHPDQEIVQPDGSKVKVSYPPTGAVYENKIYPGSGVIIGESNWGPQHRIAIKGTSKEDNWDPATMRPPGLCQLSDIWWFMWKKYAAPAPYPDLRYIAQHNIVNKPTKRIIARALRYHWPNDEETSQGRAPAWPGKVFTPGMEGFAAMLGAPNFWGTPFFLIQHGGDGQLGKMEVKKITVYVELKVDPGAYQPCAIAEIGKVEG